jgi:hypothetical protein
MKIETEYSPGDIVWVMNNDKTAKARIVKVEITIASVAEALRTSNTTILYYADNRPMYYSSSEVFKSKDALIQSL